MTHSHAEPFEGLATPASSASKAAAKTPPSAAKAEADAGASLLDRIESPADVRALSLPQLERLAAEVRQRIIEVIARNGGHFGAPLGVVDLTIALMHELDLPRDRVVWDVGHQAYAWKILTGRNDRFETIRKYGGLSGFLKRSESEYDTFGAGHASTSIAAGLGMALARDCKGEDFRVVPIIGDGAMTGGMAYEALNNAGLRKTRMMLIFNDNEMSISENVWVVHEWFRKAVTHPLYSRARKDVVELIKKYSPERVIEYAHRAEEAIKGLIVPGLFFEELGFRYIGPVDGHDMEALVKTIRSTKDFEGPIVLHLVTQKGKGYSFAEADPIKYHAASDMKIETGEMAKKSGPPAYTQVFGETLVEIGRENEHVVGITAAMDGGTGLNIWGKAFPERFYDVGIAEECAVTMAAGMAAEGIRPVCAIYSTFLQRAYDQVIHDVAIQNLPVFFVLDRAGLVGADGPTHHGVFDLSYLRVVPNLVVMAPADEDELRDMTLTGVLHTSGPIAMRYPRGAGDGIKEERPPRVLPIGKSVTLREGKRVALIGIGRMVRECLAVADLLGERLGHEVTVINARFVKPLDREAILAAAESHELLVTVEDNALVGGFGSAVNEMLNEAGSPRQAMRFGIPDRFIDHGSPAQLFEEIGLTPRQIAAAVLERLA